jgi:anti-sigma factor RsiW
MYENAAAQRVTLYITSALPDRRETWAFETRGGVDAYYWANELVTCTVVADADADELRRLGRTIFAQLTRRPDTAPRTW